MHQLYFIGELLQEKVKNRVFVKLDCRYADYFPEYSNYFRRALGLLQYTYGMNNSGKLFSDDLTEWLIEAGIIKYQCQMYIYYKYAPDVTHIFLLSYVENYVYWHTSEAIGK